MRLFQRKAFEQELTEELRLHLESRIDDLVRSGLARDEATRRAGIEFGGVEKYKERCRASLGLQFVDDLRSDLLFFLRSLRRNALLSAVVVLTLTLGIGMDTGVFTMINAVAFRARVDKDPDSYLLVFPEYSQDGRRRSTPGWATLADYGAFRDGTRSLNELAAWHQFEAALGDDLSETRSLLVTCNFFSQHGLEKPLLGRLFAPTDCSQPGGAAIIVLSEEIWRDRFGADPSVVGKPIRLNAQLFTVVGVAPFQFSGKINGAKAWMPYTMQPLLGFGYDAFRANEIPWLMLAGHLKAGYSRQDAKNELSVLAVQQDRLYPGRKTTLTITDGSWFQHPSMRQIGIWTIPLMMGALTLVLLIACANVTTLLLSRAAARQHEISVRLALGTGRARLLRMLLTESLMLASVAGLFSLFMAYRIPLLLDRYVARDPGQFRLTPDWRVFAYTCGTALLAGCLSGLTPALESLKVEVSASLKGIGGLLGGAARSGSRTRDFLVGAQVAMSLVLLAGAGIFVHAHYKLMTADPGFDTRKTLFVQMRQRDQSPGKSLGSGIEQRVAALPGVRSVAFAQAPPFMGQEWRMRWQIAPNEPPRQALTNFVSPAFFQTLGIPILHGRGFSTSDTPAGTSASVAVVSETCARLFWPGESPIGKRITAAGLTLEVVGVARDASSTRFATSDDPLLYVIWNPVSRVYPMLVHFSGDSQAMERAVGTAMREMAPNVAIMAQTIQFMLDQQISGFGKLVTLVLILGGVALALATMGIYGVVAFAATRRTKELGIRMALGARRKHIIWEMLTSTAKPIASGLIVGLLLALAASVVLTKAMARAPVIANARDPIAYVAVSLLLAATAAIAILIPARRAAAADPLQALRQE